MISFSLLFIPGGVIVSDPDPTCQVLQDPDAGLDPDT